MADHYPISIGFRQSQQVIANGAADQIAFKIGGWI